MVEVDGDFFLSSVDLSSKAFEIKLYLKIIRSIENDLRVDKMQNILLVAYTRPVVSPFYLVEGGVGPILLVAGVDDAVGAGDDEVGVLDGHLVGVVMEELVDKGLVYGQ